VISETISHCRILESEGVHFIAMEYVDGETLREKIHRDKASLLKLLKYLTQVAEVKSNK
jgi:serine/threonine protein kinase